MSGASVDEFMSHALLSEATHDFRTARVIIKPLRETGRCLSPARCKSQNGET